MTIKAFSCSVILKRFHHIVSLCTISDVKNRTKYSKMWPSSCTAILKPYRSMKRVSFKIKQCKKFYCFHMCFDKNLKAPHWNLKRVYLFFSKTAILAVTLFICLRHMTRSSRLTYLWVGESYVREFKNIREAKCKNNIHLWCLGLWVPGKKITQAVPIWHFQIFIYRI